MKQLKDTINIVLLLAGLVLLSRFIAFADEKQGSILNERCTHCHGLERIEFFGKNRNRWQVTINRMYSRAGHIFSEDDIPVILDELTDKYPLDRKLLFHNTCLACHKAKGKEDLLHLKKTKQSWALAIERMRRKYNFIIGVEESKELLEYWSAKENNPDIVLISTEEDRVANLYEEKCARCHTYRFIKEFKADSGLWHKIIKRMQAKSPALISDEQADEISGYVSKNNLITDNP